MWDSGEKALFFFFNQIRDLKLGIESYFDFTVGSVIGVYLSIKLIIKLGWETLLWSSVSFSSGFCWAGRPFRMLKR